MVRNANLNVYLHEGYDWADTRKAILERTRTVRRRLEKIRQLLASGQTPDSSVDEASVVMFGSVQLGLPPGSNDLSPKELLAAIDQELGDGTEVDEQSTIAPSLRPTSEDVTQRSRSTRGRNGQGGRRRRRLTRSTSAAVQLRLHGLSASLDIFEGSDELSRNTSTRSEAEKSRLDVRVAELEIIDNVKTSTWHKFLSELRPSDGGTLRPSNSPMARAEIKAMRGDRGPGNAPTEFLLKVGLYPSLASRSRSELTPTLHTGQGRPAQALRRPGRTRLPQGLRGVRSTAACPTLSTCGIARSTGDVLSYVSVNRRTEPIPRR